MSGLLPQVNEAAALRLIEAFQEKAKSLEQFPERDPGLIDPLITTGKYRRLLLEKRYLLVYQIKETAVYVDAVVDTRQDYGWLLYDRPHRHLLKNDKMLLY